MGDKNDVLIQTKLVTIDIIKRKVQRLYRRFSPVCLDFLIKVLDPSPESRISIDEALNHEWL